jgi:hypothetical protein
MNKPGLNAIVLAACLGASAAQAQVHATPDRIGDVLQYIVPLGALALAGWNRDLEGMEDLGLSLAVAQGTTQVLKYAVRERRPDGTGLSFPSGHTSAVFASAAFVHQRYGLALAAPFYALATETAYSRVHTHHHFTRDVIGGAAVGVASGFLLTTPRERGPQVSAALVPGGAVIAASHRW